MFQTKKGKLCLAVALTAALALSALAAVLAVTAADSGGYNLAVRMEGAIPPSEVLVLDDLLTVKVSTEADFPVYANYTVMFYDERYFEPADAGGSVFDREIQGEGITDYLSPEASPLWGAGEALGDLNVRNLADYPPAWKDAAGALLPAYEHYAAIALKIPNYNFDNDNAPDMAEGKTPWCSFNLRVKDQLTAGQATANIFFAREACRSYPERYNTAMYYCAGLSSDSYRNVALELSPALEYTVEALAANPMRVCFTAGTGGSLGGGFDAVRNIPQGTAIAGLRTPEPIPAAGYDFIGWAYLDDYEKNGAFLCTLLDDSTQLETDDEGYMPEIHLAAVFYPLVTLSYYDSPGGTLFKRVAKMQDTVVTDEYIKALGEPYRKGYHFVEWRTVDGDAAHPASFERDTDLAAVWTPRAVRVNLVVEDKRLPAGAQQIPVDTFDLYVNDSYAASVPGEAALYALVADVAADSEYVFEAYGPAQANDFYIVPATDEAEITVVAARVHRGTCVVSYDANGGTGAPGEQEKLRGDSINLSYVRPVWRGRTFLGWATAHDAEKPEYASGAVWSGNADLKLFAVWQLNPDPVIEGNATLRYKGSTTLALRTAAPGMTSWKSSNEKIATVDGGEIKGLKRGTAVITATDGEDYTATCTVNVKYTWWQWIIVICLFGWIWY